MKKILSLTAICMILFVSVASAGVLGSTWGFVSGKLGWGFLGFLATVGGVFLKGKYDLNKAVKALREMKEVYEAYTESNNPDSDGGVKRTEKEWAKIGKESTEAISAVLNALPPVLMKKVGFGR